MYVIAGLGNPGSEYENTRHNVGFRVIDELSERLHAEVGERKFFALCGRASLGAERILLMKPQTYMNRSGESIRAAADFYKVEAGHIIVISDDIDLEEGRLRIRLRGSAGGHNGLKSVIAHLGTSEFPRIRVGVGGKPEGWDLADYVLGRIRGGEAKLVEEGCGRAAEAACLMAAGESERAMNLYNRKPEKAKE